MTVAELTTEINDLTLAERQKVSIFVSALKRSRKAQPAMGPYTKRSFYAALKESRTQSEKGQTTDAYQSLAELRDRYGIPA